MTRLSDELLDWILAPPLHVPDELFADPGLVSPFSRATYSASDVLLVCKSWMRLATPALYATVVIRSTAQAQALAEALSRNPEFARFVKKLRVEGAYGKYLRSCVPLMTNVTDFCMALSVRSSDDIGGLALALKTFNPTRVILTLPPLKVNAKYKALLSKLAASIANWTHLTHFCFAQGAENCVWECGATADLTEALSKLCSLESVHYPFGCWGLNLAREGIDFIAKLLSNPSLKSLVLHCSPKYTPHRETFPALSVRQMDRLYVLPAGANLKHPFKLMPKSESTQNQAVTVTNPFYRPLHNLTHEARIEIWSKIFDFAIVSLDNQPSYYSWNHPRLADGACFTGVRVNKTAVRALLLVSHEFKSAVLRAVCRHIVIKEENRLRKLEDMLQRGDSLGQWVEAIWLQDDPDLSPPNLRTVFQVTTGLRFFSAESFCPQLFRAFPTLFRSAGHAIQKIILVDRARMTRRSGITDPLVYTGDVFKELVALEVLEWDVEHISFDATDVADLFPRLRQLSLRRTHATFVDLLAGCSLPMLSQLSLGKGFLNGISLLQQHGSKISMLAADLALLNCELDACPALVTLDVSEHVAPSAVYHLAHAHLRTIRLHWRIYDAARYRSLGQHLLPDKLPGLREVVVTQEKDIWPLSEREIVRNPWPKIAALFARHGVSLLDHTGRGWRPRLQVQ